MLIKNIILRFNLFKNEVKVGLFILAPTVIIILVVILKLGYSIFTSTMDVYLKLDSMKTIKKGTPVTIKGYEIGSVVAVKPVYKPALHFLATMRLKRDIELYEDCSAMALSQSVIGDPVVELRNPEKKGEPLREDDVIECIEGGSIEEILRKVNTLLTEVNSIMAVYREVSVDNKTNLKGLIGGLTGTIQNLNNIMTNSQRDIIDMFDSLRKTTATLNDIALEVKKNPVKFLFSGKKQGADKNDSVK